MAKKRMMAKQIQQKLDDMLIRETVMQRAVHPEAALGADLYLSSAPPSPTPCSPTSLGQPLLLKCCCAASYTDGLREQC
jgi:hypothetical protein